MLDKSLSRKNVALETGRFGWWMGLDGGKGGVDGRIGDCRWKQ